MRVVIAGSVSLDTVKTSVEEHTDVLGGSAAYAAVAASFFTPSQLVSIVGSEFSETHLAYFQSRGIDLEGLQKVPGETCRESAEYSNETIGRKVLEHFTQQLPESYRKTLSFSKCERMHEAAQRLFVHYYNLSPAP